MRRLSGGKRMSHEYSVVSLNMKNLMPPTPRNSVLKSFILALNDSAEALVSLCSKSFYNKRVCCKLWLKCC